MIKIVNEKSSDSTKNKTEKVKERESKITGLKPEERTTPPPPPPLKKKQAKQTNKQKGKRENRDLQKNIGYDKENIEKIRKKILIIQKPEKKS